MKILVLSLLSSSLALHKESSKDHQDIHCIPVWLQFFFLEKEKKRKNVRIK